MDPNYVRLVEEGLRLTAVDYKRTEIVYTEAWRKLCPVLKTHDALLCPTEAIAPPGVERAEHEFDGLDEEGRYLGLDMTMHFNALKLPALSLPTGFDREGLPTGMQIVGRRYDDLTVLKLAAAFEQAQPWAGRRPPI